MTTKLPDAVKRALEKDLTIDISTTGRKTGGIRRIEIWFKYIDGRVFITGTPGKRDWYANLLKTPSFTFHLKESVQQDLSARAKPILDHAERSKILSADIMAWYHQESPSKEAFINEAPLVEVFFELS